MSGPVDLQAIYAQLAAADQEAALVALAGRIEGVVMPLLLGIAALLGSAAITTQIGIALHHWG